MAIITARALWAPLAVFALCAIVLVVASQRFKFMIRSSTLLTMFDAKTGRVCSVVWSDVTKPCSLRLALASTAIQRRPLFIRLDVDYRSRHAFEAPLCSKLRIIHVGNVGTTVALANGHNYYFTGPLDAPRDPESVAWSHAATGDFVQLCGDGRVATVIKTGGAAIDALQLW